MIGLLSVKDDQFMDCQSHHLLGNIYSSKDETAKAIDHYETALGIASSFNWHTQQSIVHHPRHVCLLVLDPNDPQEFMIVADT